MKWRAVAVVIPVGTLNEKVESFYYNTLLQFGVNRNLGKGSRILPTKYQGLWVPNFTLECFIKKL